MEEQVVAPPEGAEAAAVQEIPAEVPEEPKTPETPEVTEQEEVVIPPPVKQTAQERINEITRKRREAEREVERLKKELEEKAQAKTVPTDRPKIENFETQEAYEDAVYEWRDRQRRNETLAEQKHRVLVARSGTRFAGICCHFVPTIPAYQVPAAPKHPALDLTIFRGCCSKYLIKQFS